MGGPGIGDGGAGRSGVIAGAAADTRGAGGAASCVTALSY